MCEQWGAHVIKVETNVVVPVALGGADNDLALVPADAPGDAKIEPTVIVPISRPHDARLVLRIIVPGTLL